MTTSVLAHLALTFGGQTENLATEALGYILRNSPGARAAVEDLLRAVGCSVPDGLSWVNQLVTEDDARPDLVGIDANGKPSVFIEAKFWAGLTDNQPVGYLERLPTKGSLIFVAPGRRETLLWAELHAAVHRAGLPFAEHARSPHGVYVSTVGDKTMALLSWRALLSTACIRAADEATVLADIAQLQGLCNRMDSEAFIPVTNEELTDHRYRRILEFSDIVDDVTSQLIDRGLASTRGYRATSGKGFYARYMRINEVLSAGLACDVRQWMEFGTTPVWLTLSDPEPEISRRLAPLAVETPCRLFKSSGGYATVPIFVPVGMERHAVIQRMVEQVSKIASMDRARIGQTDPVIAIARHSA